MSHPPFFPFHAMISIAVAGLPCPTAIAQPLSIELLRPAAIQAVGNRVIIAGTIGNTSGGSVVLNAASLGATNTAGPSAAQARLAPEFLAIGPTIPVQGYSGPLVTLAWPQPRGRTEVTTVRLTLASSSLEMPTVAEVIVPPCASRIGWSEVVFPPASARLSPATAWSSRLGMVLSFGGRKFQLGRCDEFWSFDGQSWQMIPPSGAWPSARSESALVWSEGEDAAILYGGLDASGVLGDSWRYDGGTWINITTADDPPSRTQMSMAYDSLHKQTVLFGGWRTGVGVLGDTWIRLDGAGWLSESAPLGVSPEPRCFASMSFDPVRGVTVLFGGWRAANPNFGDTWEWDGFGWRQVADTGPSPRRAGAMWFDTVAGRVTLFGGRDEQSHTLNDTWQWFGDHWEEVGVPSVTPAAFASGVYIPTLQQALVLGGQLPNGAYRTGYIVGVPVEAADFNTDGFVDFFDFADFADCFEGFTCPAGRTADFNADGFADFFDVDDFVASFEAGC